MKFALWVVFLYVGLCGVSLAAEAEVTMQDNGAENTFTVYTFAEGTDALLWITIEYFTGMPTGFYVHVNPQGDDERTYDVPAGAKKVTATLNVVCTNCGSRAYDNAYLSYN